MNLKYGWHYLTLQATLTKATLHSYLRREKMPLVIMKIQGHGSRNKAYPGAQRGPEFPEMLETIPMARKLELLVSSTAFSCKDTKGQWWCLHHWQETQSASLELTSSSLINGNGLSSGRISPAPVQLVKRRPADVPGHLYHFSSLFPPYSSAPPKLHPHPPYSPHQGSHSFFTENTHLMFVLCLARETNMHWVYFLPLRSLKSVYSKKKKIQV